MPWPRRTERGGERGDRGDVVEGDERGVAVVGGDAAEALEDGEGVLVDPLERHPDLGAHGDVGQRARADDPASVEDHDVVAHLLDLAEEVRVEEHGGAAVAQRADEVAHLAATDRVEGRRRLVEDHQHRPAEHRGGEAEPLLHALRVTGDAVVTAAGEPDEVERVGDGRGALVGGQPQQPAVRPRGPAARRAKPGTGTARAGTRRRAGPRGPRPDARGPSPAAVEVDHPEERLHDRRLARAVGPEQADDLSGPDVEVDAVERLPLLVRLAETGGLDRRTSIVVVDGRRVPPARGRGSRRCDRRRS